MYFPSPPTHEKHSLRILDVFESDCCVSQRSLAGELGIALGLTNLLVKRLVSKGFVRVTNIKPNRVGYLLTPAGIAEKTRMSRAYFEGSVLFYREARDRIHKSFSALSNGWPGGDSAGEPKRIVFYGAGEVAEIGYVCLAETDLQLVGVVDERRTRPFFGMAVRSPDDLDHSSLSGYAFDRLVVMSFGSADAIRPAVLAQRIPPERVFWL